MQKDLFKIYRQFGRVSSERFVSPGLQDSDFLFEHCFFSIKPEVNLL